MWVYNYRTLVHQLSLEGVVNLGNLLFHRERTRWNIYALAGVSGFLFNTKYDALDKNGEVYDFSEIQDIWIKGKSSPYVNNDKNVRKSVFASLKRTLDGKYETQADNDANLPGIKFWTFIPAITVG